MISILYAGILGLMFVGLSLLVVQGRYSNKMPFGDGGNPDMIRRVRVHGNFAEYVPFAVLLICLVDYYNYSPLVIHLLGAALVIARIFHGLALYKHIFVLRVLGVVMTLIVLLVSSLLLLWHYFAVQMTGL